MSQSPSERPQRGLALSRLCTALAAAALLAGGLAWAAHAEPSPVPLALSPTKIAVEAEVDFTTQLILTEQGRDAFVMPLLPAHADAGGDRNEAPVIGALVWPGATRLSQADLDALIAATATMGRSGPVVRVSARWLEGAPYAPILAAALASEGRSMVPGAPMLVLSAPVPPDRPWAELLLSIAVAFGLLGAVLRFRYEAKVAEAKPVHHRIPAYAPGLDVFWGAEDRVGETVVAMATAEASLRTPETETTDAEPKVIRRRTPGAALFTAVRLGQSWAEDLRLSPRALARLNADPLVSRLGKLT